jgi:hypothetical protein
MTQVVKDSFNGEMHGRPALAPARRQAVKPPVWRGFRHCSPTDYESDLTAPFKANGTAPIAT